jgi:RNA polymerase sigma factor (sigma-70 family)
MHDARDAEDRRLLGAGEIAGLLATYYPVVVERCRARIHTEGDAYDVAHRVMERLLGELRRGKTYRVPFRVVVHKVVDWKLAEHFTGPPSGVIPEDWDPAGDDPYTKFEEDFDLERLFADLPLRSRQVLDLRWRQGLEIDEIAEQLGMERNAVDQALWRGMNALRKLLSG